jgi:hypothetical protein
MKKVKIELMNNTRIEYYVLSSHITDGIMYLRLCNGEEVTLSMGNIKGWTCWAAPKREITIPPEMIDEIEQITNRQKYGFESPTEFVKEAVRKAIVFYRGID